MLRPATLAPAPAKKLSNLLRPIVDQSVFQALARPKSEGLPHRKTGEEDTREGSEHKNDIGQLRQVYRIKMIIS